MLCGKRCCAKPRQTKPEQNGTTKPPQDVFNLSTGGDGRLATVRGGRRTLEGRQQRGQEGLYDAPEWGYNAQESLLPGNLDDNDDDVDDDVKWSLLPGNLYEATPDHSILKNGLAKSLSRVDIAEAASAPPMRVRMEKQGSRRLTHLTWQILT